MNIVVLWIALIVLSLVSLFVGVKDLSPLDLFQLDELQAQVLWVTRIPRLISILIAGSSLSVVGFLMQQLSRNKFVSPTTAGTMDAASLGIMVSMIYFSAAGLLSKMVVAFLFALLGTFLFMQFLQRIRFQNTVFIPLVGIMFGNIISSLTTFLGYRYDMIQSISTWFQGDFSMVMQGRYELLYLSVPLIFVAYMFANRFTIAGMGEEFAINLGLNYRQVVNLGLVIVALVSASVVLTIGRLPFLGLIVPNIVAIYMGDHLQKSLSHTALLGALFILACDILGRILIYPYEIPIGLIVGILGSGIFLALLMRRTAHGA